MPVEGAQTYQVTELDRLYTGKPLLTCLGPVDLADDAELVAAVNRIAAGGPYTRVGLRATRESRRWTFVDAPGELVVLPECPHPCRDMSELLEHAGTVKVDASVGFWRCGQYLCTYFDHGVADAFVIMRILDALTQKGAQPGLELSGKTLTRRPMASALWYGARAQRKQFASGIAEVFSVAGSRVRGGDAPSTDSEAQAETPPAATVSTTSSAFDRSELTFAFVPSPPGYMRDLRAYRKSVHPEATAIGLVSLWICRELIAAGVQISGGVQLTTDLRRFLPPGQTTHSNFIGLIEVPFGSDTTPEQFSASVREQSATWASLQKLQTLLVVRKLRNLVGGGDRPVVSESAPPGGRTTVTITDATKWPEGLDIRYSDPARAEWSCFINPETRQHLALLFTAVPDDGIQVTARFSGTHLDRAAVEAALTRALSSERLRT